jgi:ribosomal protein S18 acetylase RimI-like enzyme
MFVIPEARGCGVARLILTELESAALRMGYSRIRLETGLRQPEAVGLYEAAGYHRVACYGGYADDPMSVCFEKHLVMGDASSESHEIQGTLPGEDAEADSGM